MRTDTRGLLEAGLALSVATWQDAAAEFDWADMDRYVAHQISQVHTRALCEALDIDAKKLPLSFPLHGNMGPAAVPFTLAKEAESLHPGDRVLLLGHRLGPEHLLRRDRLVTSRTDPAAGRPDLSGMPGLDPRWSRRVDADDADGVRRAWHVLDNGAEPVHGTMLCVHGNPTWSYLWRRFLAQAPAGWRVVAVDQLGMGWSERTAPRTLAQRVDDLGALTAALGITGPVVTVAHDWGGPVSLGWALAHRDQLRGVVLTNTAVHQPAGAAAPSLIRLARTPGLRQTICVGTPAFVRTTSALSRPALPAAVRDALAAPYATAAAAAGGRRLRGRHPAGPGAPERAPRWTGSPRASASSPTCRSLLLWGPRDPVFSDLYLRDLLARLPHAQVHRYEGASHLVTEDAPRTAGDVWRWVGDLQAAAHRAGPARPGRRRPPCGRGSPPARATPPRPWSSWGRATGACRSPCWTSGCGDLAAGLAATGVRPGDRVALLVPPGADLTAAVYACWRAGAVIVVADAGLGLRGHGPGPARRRSRPRHRHRPGPGRRPGHAACPDDGSPPARWTRPPGAPWAPGTGWPTWPGSVAVATCRRRRPTTPSAPSSSPPARPGRPRAWSTATGRCRPSSSCCARPTASPPTTAWWPRSRRSRSTARRWASPPPSPTWTSPRRARSPPPPLADAVTAVARDRGVRLTGGAAQRRGDRGRTSPTSTAPRSAGSGC